MRFSRRADESVLSRFLAEQAGQPLSYPDEGASLRSPPNGYRLDDVTKVLGRGRETFDRAAFGLRAWQAHRGAGVRVHPALAPLEAGTTVALALPLIGVFALAACRIVAVVDEPNRYGFAYGTLAAHPEQGEEAFLVEDRHDEVRFQITAFSRPAELVARVGAPIARLVQRQVTHGYLEGLANFVAHPS